MVEEQKQVPEEVPAEDDDVVTPFEIVAKDDTGIDYNKLIDKYGCYPITEELIERLERAIGERAHRFIRRGIFFCQRDIEQILDAYENRKPFFLYTGRGPSADALHMGHCIPFIFTQWLQRVFDVPLVIQITDDEKYIYKQEIELDGPKGSVAMGLENVKDILAFGFDPEKTFIFSDVGYIGHMYPNVIKVQKHVNYSQIKGIFGFKESDNIGKFAFPPVQAVPAFSNTFPHIFGKGHFPCLIPAAIDQDPYFRMTRDIAQKLAYKKPASIYSTFFPALQGKKTKMSSSAPNTSILVTDSAADIKKKINKYAKSGGGQTVEEHREKGCDLSVDVPFQYLTFFLEDDEQLEDIRVRYASGELLTGEVKQTLITVMQRFVGDLQAARKLVTKRDVEHYMSVRKIEKMPRKWLAEKAASAPKPGVTIFSDSPSNLMTASIQIAADLAGARTEVKVVDEAAKKDLLKKADILGNALPYFQVEEGRTLSDATAIARHLVRQSAKAGQLLGETPFAEAKIDQFVSMASSSIVPAVKTIELTVGGQVKDPARHVEAVKSLKETCKVLNTGLADKNWLAGDSITYADVYVFTTLVPAFQLALDAGFRKAMPALAQWFDKMTKLPVVVRRVGYVKPCFKAMAPAK